MYTSYVCLRPASSGRGWGKRENRVGEEVVVHDDGGLLLCPACVCVCLHNLFIY